jgi:hypothetical protein
MTGGSMKITGGEGGGGVGVVFHSVFILLDGDFFFTLATFVLFFLEI